MINLSKKNVIILGTCLFITVYSFITVNTITSFASKSNPSFTKSYSGLVNIDGKTYYYSKKTGKKLTGYRVIDGKKYYFSTTSGAMLSGIRSVTINGEKHTYYFLKNGDVFKSGLKEIGDKKYYFSKTTGKMLTGLRKVNDNTSYYFLSDGKVFKGGLKEIGDKKYYFSKTTGKMLTGFRTVNNKKYYFHRDGHALKNQLATINNQLYLFEKDGSIAKGAKTVNNSKYYFDLDTGAAISGLKKRNDKLYYYDKVTYKAIVGFKTINNDTYYFHNKYNYALTGLQSFGDKLYYFKEDNCKMLKNDTITYANIEFTFNNAGISIKQSVSKEFEKDARTKLIFNGLKKLGAPYGTSDGEFRCNTFVDYCYKTVNIDTLQNLTSSRQAKYLLRNNKDIPFEKLKPGDLIFYNSENCDSVESKGSCGRVEIINNIRLHVHHVGIYIGKGKMLDSTQTVSEGFGRVKVTDFNPDTTSKTYYPILYANILD